ncbi:hypothetical protein V3W47_18590 [Deinococcus sp. YIM 134068]|uniref:hypothetical protein n=1 Tax=Deinococcus lichenicola TaxID=3118910 RepID=UPI002F94B5FE
MTAATRIPRYFVLIVDGQPYTLAGTPDIPMIFRDEQSAVTASAALWNADRPRAVVLESYADDYSFLDGRPLEGPAVLSIR